MLKKRLIFTLLYQEKNFYLSRNFRLQKIGDLNWLKKNYNFSLLTKSVDEIILLNVSRNKSMVNDFCKTINSFSKECFIPISAGGCITSPEIAKIYIDSGADKLVINTELFNFKLIDEIAKLFGEQCIIGSIDFTRHRNIYKFFQNNGLKENKLKIFELFKKILSLKIGELYLNSIDRDGTGNGFDFDILKYIPKDFYKPIIFAGGAGNYKHLLQAFKKKKIHSIATANLLNFVGDGLQDTRFLISKKGIKLAEWI